jgi:hypothetical protein
MRKRPAAYHTPAGEADRLRQIIEIYSYDPEAVALATEALRKHIEEHPELKQPS